MRTLLLFAAWSIAAAASAQGDARRNPLDPQAKVPAAQYRSALEGYQPFADQELRNWRQSNDEVGAAGGHAGHKPGQGPSKETSKPQPGKPPAGGHGAHK